MTPDARAAEPVLVPGRHLKPALPPGANRVPSDRLSELDALSSATSRYSRTAQPTGRTRSPLNLALPCSAAAIVGTVLAVAMPSERSCVATFKITSGPRIVHDFDPQAAMADYASRLEPQATDAAPADVRWWVDAPTEGTLRLGVTTADRRWGVEQASAAAQGFLSSRRKHAEEVRRTPSEAERVLSEFVSQLQERASKTQGQVDTATASLPQADPRVDRDALLDRWRALRSDFAAASERLAEASAGVNKLQAESERTHGIVSAEDRRSALESDAALQQDLRELEVKLSELKLHLLNVWQQSAGRLEQLRTATDDLLGTASQSDTARLPQNIQAAVEGITAETEPYRQTLSTFADAWTGEFTALQRLQVDAQSGEILDAYQRIRSLLSDFLFAASQKLSSVRSHLTALEERPSDNARYHVLQSNLTRAFQAAQSAHHRFEFAAGALDTPDNFRLDAALRGARGLRRRTLEQIQHTEQRLQTEAIERAKTQRAKALAEAEHAVERTRATSEETIEQLFAVQDGLIQAAGLTEGFLHAVLQAELAANRLRTAQEDLSRAQTRLRELAAGREAAGADIGIDLVSCGVIGSEVKFGKRLRLGGIGFVVTLVGVLSSQWWVARRPS